MLFGLLGLEYKRERRATVLIVGERINGCWEAKGRPEKGSKLFDNASLLFPVITSKKVFGQFGHFHFYPSPALILTLCLYRSAMYNLDNLTLWICTHSKGKGKSEEEDNDLPIYNMEVAPAGKADTVGKLGKWKLGMFILILILSGCWKT